MPDYSPDENLQRTLDASFARADERETKATKKRRYDIRLSTHRNYVGRLNMLDLNACISLTEYLLRNKSSLRDGNGSSSEKEPRESARREYLAVLLTNIEMGKRPR